MPEITYKIEERRQKLHIRAYALLCAVMALAMGLYVYAKWTEYDLARRGVNQNRQFVSSLRAEAAKDMADFDLDKKEHEQLSRDIEQKLKVIFPATDDYTALTRQIDFYEMELSKKNSPFEISNIDYQGSSQDENYSILPFSMNIRSSRENFIKFLHLIENSGALKNKIRLMDISTIRLTFVSDTKDLGAPEIISFFVQINAYFQK